MALLSRRSRKDFGKYRKFEVISLLVLSASLLFIINSPVNKIALPNDLVSRLLQVHTADTVNQYSQDSIMKTAPKFPKFVPKLLVFDGNKFQFFGLQHKGTEYFENMRYTYRYIDTIPMLAHALKENFPDRFKPGMPPFELLFSDADSPHSDCENSQCRVQDFAPMILFGSVPKDQSIYPTLRSFPHPVFMHCLYHSKVNGAEQCDWQQKPNVDVPWEELQDTVIWRGADWPFLPYIERYTFEGPTKVMEQSQKPAWKDATKSSILEELTSEERYKTFPPRWRAALMSVQAEDGDATPWIDTRFVGGMNPEVHAKLKQKGVNVTGDRIDAHEMSNYKYQVDLGGGGGTTWEGTLTKLMMPGVLFHHETETKDWYYDMMVPWKHYVPIKWDLSDLWTSFAGAQSNQQQMHTISAEATKLAQYMVSPEYMEEVYQELFVDYLGKLVNAYQPQPGASWSDIKEKYQSNGFNVYNVASCQKNICQVQCQKGVKENVLYINGNVQKHAKDATDAAAADDAPEQQTEQAAPEIPTEASTDTDSTTTSRALRGGTTDGQYDQQQYPQQQQYGGQYWEGQYGAQPQYNQQQQYDASGAYAYNQQQQPYNNDGTNYGYANAQQQQWTRGAGYGDANAAQQQQWAGSYNNQAQPQASETDYADTAAPQASETDYDSSKSQQPQASQTEYADANAQQYQAQSSDLSYGQWNSQEAQTPDVETENAGLQQPASSGEDPSGHQRALESSDPAYGQWNSQQAQTPEVNDGYADAQHQQPASDAGDASGQQRAMGELSGTGDANNNQPQRQLRGSSSIGYGDASTQQSQQQKWNNNAGYAYTNNAQPQQQGSNNAAPTGNYANNKAQGW